MRRRKAIPGSVGDAKARQALRREEDRLLGFAAINRVRKGESRTLSSAARAEGTSLKTIQKLLPAALQQDRSGGRIRVKPSDRYSARVEILAKDVGPKVVTARGSRQRELAGQHRAVYNRVLEGVDPPSALDQFRGKKVGGHELVSDFEELSMFAKAGFLSQLDSLYASPETSL
jgi:hypothetical protein